MELSQEDKIDVLEYLDKKCEDHNNTIEHIAENLTMATHSVKYFLESENGKSVRVEKDIWKKTPDLEKFLFKRRQRLDILKEQDALKNQQIQQSMTQINIGGSNQGNINTGSQSSSTIDNSASPKKQKSATKRGAIKWILWITGIIASLVTIYQAFKS